MRFLYRQTDGSAMKNLRGLELGYIQLIKKVQQRVEGGWMASASTQVYNHQNNDFVLFI